ncbi:hypothetical protein LSH36_65g04031 [Paralvinella palmiformis]|uniref:Uncharacterized protein n=1 Tax=Paralvinella palmiformis TaxID=53620 RepID=A0AAD9K3N8_9ANNE|nr:hypothetical protein LSH36_65g04031 [Paralvinella palmiformis]
MGEFRVHRVRFFEYNPCAVHCLAYENSHKKLAVSRSDATIEIWNLKHSWFQEKILPPSEGASVEALLWKGSRLFAAGLHGNLQEYDVVTGRVTQSLSANSGPIWCLAMKEDGSQLAAGTEDGCVVLFRITSDGLEYSRALSKQEGRILCVAWYSTENVMITGGIDNIRIWSLASGHAIQRLTLARVERQKETIVWTLAVTRDYTIISGDSTGKTSFWNGRQGTLIKSFRSHRADVLCLCVNEEGNSVFSSGVDPNLVQFEYIASNPSSDWKMWVRSTVRTQHTHDVRALVLSENKLISGGVSAHLLVSNLEERSGVKPWSRIPAIPHVPLVHTAKRSHVVMFRYAKHLELWKLGSTKKKSDKNGENLPLQTNPLKLLHLKAHNEEYIVCSALSQDSTWLAYSDQYKLRLFQIEIENKDLGSPHISVNKVRNLPPGVNPAYCLTFMADGTHLISATISGKIQIIKLDSEYPELVNTLTPPNTGIAILVVVVKHNWEVGITILEIVEFSIKENNYTEWTLEHMYHFPHMWQKSQHKIREPFPKKTIPVFVEAQKKTNHAFHTCAKFKFLMHVTMLEDDFMLAVERTPLAMLETLPEALKQKKFGT